MGAPRIQCMTKNDSKGFEVEMTETKLSESITFRTTPTVKQKIQNKALKNGQTVTAFVTSILAQFFEQKD